MKRVLIFSLALISFISFSTPCLYGDESPVAVKKSSKSSTSKKKKGKSAKKKTKGKSRKAKRLKQPKPLPKQPPALVKEMRYWSNPDYTRIAVTLSRMVEVEHDRLPSGDDSTPPRIYIDLKGARLGQGVKDIHIANGLLKTARIAQYRKDVVRVVLDIENIKEYSVFPLEDPYRLIIDVKGERPAEIGKTEETIQSPLPGATEVKPSEEKAAVAKAPAKIRRIVVDAGHGGKDSGAIGAGGTMEKDVVLAIALKLAKKLKDELGVDVVMTRSSDVFIPLEERTAIANKVNADLFVSIHANASLNRTSEGMETYYLNLAKTDKAAQVAARENNTSLEKVSVLQAILFDLMANYKINDSAHLADEVQKAAYKRVSKDYKNCHNNGVKQGPFYVLVGATMPSILVETAFISNEQEEKRLRDHQFQESAASGIVDGIKAYMAGLK